jgi:hypothetical protein
LSEKKVFKTVQEIFYDKPINDKSSNDISFNDPDLQKLISEIVDDEKSAKNVGNFC